MKAIQKILVGVVGALGLGLGYHFFFSSSLDRKVRENEETVTRHEATLDRHDTEIEATKKEAAGNTKRIETLESDLQKTQSDLQKTQTDLAQTQKDVETHEAKVRELDTDSRENSEQLTRLRGELDGLRTKFAELERNQERLRRAATESRQLIRTRLDQIEKRLGITPPDP